MLKDKLLATTMPKVAKTKASKAAHDSARGSWQGLLFFLAFCALLFGSAAESAAQTAYYSGVTKTVKTLSDITVAAFSMAMDANGNIFLTFEGSTVYEIKAVDGVVSNSSTVVPISTAFTRAEGVATDASGNVYVTDYNSYNVNEIALVNGVYSSTLTLRGVGLADPRAVAVNASGILIVGENEMVGELLSGSTQREALGNSFDFGTPFGVAVDSGNNVFVADADDNVGIYELKANNGGLSTLSTSVIQIGSGFISAGSVALAPDGSVFASDLGDTSGNYRGVRKIVPDNGSFSTASKVLTMGSGFNFATALAADKKGNIFVVDYSSSSVPSVKEIEAAAVDFGTTSVGSTGETILVPFIFTNTTAAKLSGWNVVTQGATGLDFTEVSGSTTCSTSTSYSSGNTCSVAVQFSPKYPGSRSGAVQLLDSTGAVIATANLQGIGSGPLVGLTPGTITTVAGNGTSCSTATNTCGDGGAATSANLYVPYGIAIDGAGNLYISDTADHRIRKVDAITQSISTVVGSGQPCSDATGTCGDGGAATSAQLNNPTGIALDSAGNLYIADHLKVVINVVAPEKSIVPWAWATPANESAMRVGAIVRMADKQVVRRELAVR
ncbi:hypothetical protein ACOBR2_10995 [Telmatobacter bradus]|uniref:NHL domain-containing protein n=1 Tax=Telmatobacter bradus TaxID=474953 RepID=UPI003B42D859